ncbi:MAG: hypothetical protein KC777_05560 [Cyanobacteria bacterium HKST-UBA02]|nr:hypothetical protein [Cyanobacteria bacterium HKST-UBA02]
MRYLTNQLGWRSDRTRDNTWVNNEGSGLMPMFSFGGPHGYQAPVGRERLFATEQFSIEQAACWLDRGPFESLLSGNHQWCAVLSQALGMDIPMHDPDKEPGSLRLGKGDFVLRVSYPIELDEKGMSDAAIMERLAADRSLLRFFLHFIAPFEPSRAYKWDAGL